MKNKRWSTAFVFALFCACFSVSMVACGSTHSTPSTRLKYTERKVSPGATSTSGSNGGRTEYVGEIPDMNAWLAITSDGKNILAFTTDGNAQHTATFAQWFAGSIMNNAVQASPLNLSGMPTTQATPQATTQTTATPQTTVQATATSGKGNQGQLSAKLTQNAAIGKVTLSDGKSFPFTANAITDPNSMAGLYGDTQTINTTKYQAGWIIPPNAVPSAVGTATPEATITATPEATATITGTPGSSATETPSVSMTPSPTSTATTGANPAGGSAIINEQTGQFLPAPMPSSQDLSSKKIDVPNLGSFNLRH
jgi:hypothetical protein